MGVIPWSPLARGRLARPWGSETNRTESDGYAKNLYTKTADADKLVAERVQKVARRPRRSDGAGGAGVAADAIAGGLRRRLLARPSLIIWQMRWRRSI